MSQTAVANQGQLNEGMKADSGFDDILSALAEGAIPFGRYVKLGTDPDRQVELPGAAIDITVKKTVGGIALHNHAIESELNGVNPPQYKDKDAVSYMRKGRVAVFVEEAVTPADAVFVRFAVDTFAGIGQFRTDVDTASAAELANARFITSTTGPGIAILEVKIAG